MKYIPAILSLSTLLSCAGLYRSPESIGQKMHRYRSKEIRTNITPDVVVSDFKRSRSRSIASQEQQDLSINNKKVYFMSLLKQYDTFVSIYPEYGKKINLCPRFHQEMLEHKEKGLTENWNKKESITHGSPIVDALRKDHSSIEDGIKAHIQRNHDELAQLCEQGSSHNYYIYENLVSLSREPGVLLGNTDGINILLKSPIFFNMKVISSVATKSRVKARGIASHSEAVDFEYEALSRIGSTWATDYLNK